jgi:hypothetical protein
MKKRLIPLLFALALFVPVAPMFVAGCKSPSVQTATYNTLATVGHTANSAYAAYLDLVIKGSVGTNEVPTISKSYKDFQSVYAVAIAIAQFNPTNAAPQNVIDAANQVVALISTVKGK